MIAFRQIALKIGIILLTLSEVLAQSPSTTLAWATRFEKIRPSDDVFIVTRSGKMGVANRAGQLLTQIEYDTIYNFSEGMAIVGRGRREVNQFGKVLSDFKYGYINKTGRLVVPTKYEYIESFSEGLGYVLPSLHEDVWFDKEGKPVLALGHLTHGESFKGNMAYVMFRKVGFHLSADYPGQKNPFDIRGNYIDHQGRLLVPWKYDTIAPYYPGYVRAVRKGDKWGFLDSTARVAVPLVYDDIDVDSAFFWQNRRRVGQAGRFGFMDVHTGRLLVPLQFDDTRPSQKTIVWVKKNGHWGCIDSSGNVVIPIQYDDAKPFDEYGLSVVKQREKWGLVNTAGNRLAPFQYDNILNFQEERAVVKRDDKFGFIDLKGREIIPASYDEVSPFINGHGFAKRWGLFVTLDTKGNWVRVKLQNDTLKWLTISLVLLITLGLVWRRTQLRARTITA